MLHFLNAILLTYVTFFQYILSKTELECIISIVMLHFFILFFIPYIKYIEYLSFDS